MQKYGYRANEHKPDEGFTCVVCGTQNPRVTWTDLLYEAMCMACGTPYQLRDEDSEKIVPPHCNLREEFIPILKEYWEQTGRFVGLGRFMSLSRYPEVKEGQLLFQAWLGKNYPEWLKEE